MLSVEEKREKRRAYYVKNRDRILAQRKDRRLAKKGEGVLEKIYANTDADFEYVNEMRQ